MLSLLSDLSEFLTRQGTAESPYHRGFAGAAEDEAATSLGGGGMACRSKERDAVLEGAVVPVDDSRAPELLPYRDLDPSRLALSGKGQWDPSDYLGDTFWLPFKEPSCLLWTSDFDLTDVPDLSREDPDKVLALAKLWDVNGLLHLTRKPVKANMVPSCLRVFNCYKSEQVDRQIGDRRGRNQIEVPTWPIEGATEWLSPWSFGSASRFRDRHGLHLGSSGFLPSNPGDVTKSSIECHVATAA